MFATRLRLPVLAAVAVFAVACSDESILAPTTMSAPGGKNAVTTLSAPLFQTVYANDFDGIVGAEWTNNRISVAPKGQRFLGEFSNEATSLNLANLSGHDSVTVTFDLYIIRSWDGIDPAFGPDNFRLTADGRVLMNTTFSNIQGKDQNYPASIGGAAYPFRKGNTTKNALGFLTDTGSQMDATYQITLTFPHNSSMLNLTFAALGLQSIQDESWGIDNLSVTLR